MALIWLRKMKSAPLKKTTQLAASNLRGLFASLVLLCLLAASSPAQLEGTKIAFWSLRDGNVEIYVMNADGKNQVKLTDNAAVNASPSWSPDGRKIAFMSNRDGNFEIYVMNADGTNPVNLTNHPAGDLQPSWSPSPLAPPPKQNLLATFWARIKRLKLPAGSD